VLIVHVSDFAGFLARCEKILPSSMTGFSLQGIIW